MAGVANADKSISFRLLAPNEFGPRHGALTVLCGCWDCLLAEQKRGDRGAALRNPDMELEVPDSGSHRGRVERCTSKRAIPLLRNRCLVGVLATSGSRRDA